MAKKVYSDAARAEINKVVREETRRIRSSSLSKGRWHKKGGSGNGTLIIRFRLVAPISCAACTAYATVLSRPPGMTTVTGEVDGEVQVADVAGCFLVKPVADLVGSIGYASYLYHDPDVVGQQARCPFEASYNWEIMSLCCSTGTC